MTSTKQVVASAAQKAAAQAMVQRSAVTGRTVSDSVRKIAGATIEHVERQPADAAGRHRAA